MKVLQITTEIKNPSKNVIESIERFDRAIAQTSDDNEAFYEQLNFNVEFWKEHGKLPSNTDLSKVQGKGMYGR